MKDITMRIKLIANSESVPADGSTPFRIYAVVTDVATGNTLSNVNVTFTVNNNAFFDGDVATVSQVTNTDGEIHLNIYNTAVETVKVTAISNDYHLEEPGVIDISFVEIMPLSITRVYNKNKSFSEGKPVIAWTGASLHVETEGGSGNVSWRVENISGIELIRSDKNSAEFYFSEYTEKNIEGYLTASDNQTGTVARYPLKLLHFFKSYGIFAERNPGIQYPELETLKTLLSEWGDMTSYSGWSLTNGTEINSYYWFNDPSNQGVIDLADGSTGYTPSGMAGAAAE